MKVRLWGTPAEIDQATRRLVEVFDVVAVHGPSPDRGHSVLVRVYLEVRPDPTLPTSSDPPADPPARRPRGQLP